MQFAQYRPPVRLIAFWTILAWILLGTVMIVGGIWDVFNAAWIQRSLWTATVVTGAILLGCLTILGFAASEDEANRRRRLEEKGNDEGVLRDHLARAKEASQPHPKS